MEDRGTALIAWKKVCRPKKQGGLGILDIATHNKALLMKNLHKFLNIADTPWVKLIWEKHYQHGPPTDARVGSFWWKAHIALLTEFKNISTCKIASGKTALFWQDKWVDESLHFKFPQLHSFSINSEISVQQFCETSDRTEHFHLPLSTEAFNQLNLLESLIPQLTHTAKDQWSHGGHQNYSSIQIYNSLITNTEEHPVFKLIWKSKSRLKHKIFFWLAVHERINTRALLQRKGMHLENPFCPNCNQNAEETVMHLLWGCNFAQDCWNSLLPGKRRGTSLYEELILASEQLPNKLSTEIIIVGCWNIWTQRNGKIFRGHPQTIQGWRFFFKQDLNLLHFKIKEKHIQHFRQWISNNL